MADYNQRAVSPSILLISNFPPPFGGVSNQAKQIAEHASKELDVGAHVLDLVKLRLFTFKTGNWESRSVMSWPAVLSALIRLPWTVLRPPRALRGAGLLRFDRYLPWRFALLLVSLAAQRLMPRQPALVYSFHIGAPSLIGGLIAARLDVPHLKATFGEPYTNREKLQLQKELLLAAAGTTSFHPCSLHCARLLKDLFPRVLPQVLYYGSDLRTLSQATIGKHKLRRQAKLQMNVLFVGRFVEEMGIRYFLEFSALAEFFHPGRFSFSMCGQKGELSPLIAEEAAARGGMLHVAESAPMEVRNALLVRADVLIVPSVNERACFGLAVTEGLASRCFVLARDIGGHAEAALDMRDFLFERDLAPSQLLQRLAEIEEGLRSGTLDEKLDHASRSVTERFDIETCLARQMEVIGRALTLPRYKY
jgi:glycosyltransferase involved in cell wall biosynthesis